MCLYTRELYSLVVGPKGSSLLARIVVSCPPILLRSIGHAEPVAGCFNHRIGGAGELLVIARGTLILGRCLATRNSPVSHKLALWWSMLRKREPAKAKHHECIECMHSFSPCGESFLTVANVCPAKINSILWCANLHIRRRLIRRNLPAATLRLPDRETPPLIGSLHITTSCWKNLRRGWF